MPKAVFSVLDTGSVMHWTMKKTDDDKVKLWGKQMTHICDRCMASTVMGNCIVIGDNDGKIHLIEVNDEGLTGKHVISKTGLPYPVTAFAFYKEFLISAHELASIQVWTAEAETWEMMNRAVINKDEVGLLGISCLCVTNNLLFMGGVGCAGWNLLDPLVNIIKINDDPITAMIECAQHAVVASAGGAVMRGHHLQIYNSEGNLVKVVSFTFPVLKMCLAATSETIICGHHNGSITTLRCSDCKLFGRTVTKRFKDKHHNMSALTCSNIASPNGTELVALGSENGMLQIWASRKP